MRKAIHLCAVAAVLAAAGSFAGGEPGFVCTGQVAHVIGRKPQRFTLINEFPRGSDRYALTMYGIEKPGDQPALKSGDMVRLACMRRYPYGTMDAEASAIRNIVTNLEVLGHKPLPACVAVEARQINIVQSYNYFARIRGVLSSAKRDEMSSDWNWFTVRTASGNVNVIAPDNEHPLQRLAALTDAEVEVRGIILNQNIWRRFSGNYLIPTGADGITVKEKARRADAAPGIDNSAVSPIGFGFCERRGDFMHRVRANGTLVARSRRFAFIETENGYILKVEPVAGSPVPEGCAGVSASGFLSFDYNGLQMHETVFFPSSSALGLAPAPKVNLAEIHAKAIASGPQSRRRATTTGTVVNTRENIGTTGTIIIESDEVSAAVDVSAVPEKALAGIDAGATITVTGVYNAEFEADPSAAMLPKCLGFTIIPVCEDGIAVTGMAPLLTIKRLVIVTIQLLALIGLLATVCVVQKRRYDRRGRQLYDERVAHVRTEAKVGERTRLAAELHDAISQSITGVALQVDSAHRANSRGESAAVDRFLTSARLMLASCRRELQNCLWDLRSRTFDEKDMTEAIKRTISQHIEGAETFVRFNVPREKLSEYMTHAILCIVRELVANAIRHGGAKRIWIAGEYHGGQVTFSVRDDGRGFDASTAPGPSDGHFGLQGIRERANGFNGSVNVASSPGGGAKVTVRLVDEESGG